EDPGPVLLDEVGRHLLGGLASRQSLADDLAHLMGGLRGGVRYGQALADHAAKLRRDGVHRVLVDGSCGHGGEPQAHEEDGGESPLAPGIPARSGRSGSTSCFTIASVSAPTCLPRMRPARSMKKVSGTP